MAYRRLKDLREDHDLTQAELAGILNISQRGYSHYETGNNDIPTEILIKLANYYNVSIDYILERTNQKEHKKETILSH
jgi:toxin-antitoxin system, antitoxin component, xre family